MSAMVLQPWRSIDVNYSIVRELNIPLQPYPV